MHREIAVRFKLIGLLWLALLAQSNGAYAVDPVFPGKEWEVIDPARAGWSVSKLQEARDYAHEIGSSAVVVVQDGRIIAAWGSTHKKFEIHSVRKSFMSALYGIAVARHQINLSATLGQLRVDDRPPSLTRNEKQATIIDLLRARSGIYHKAAYETESMKETRPERGSHPPGQFWFYNNWDFNVLGTVLRHATGEDTFAAVEQHIARPIGMEFFSTADGHYVEDAASEHPAYTMKFAARDLARFGWLYLNHGRWQNTQVIPAEWVEETTRPFSKEARKGIDYGYLWWCAPRNIQFNTDLGPGSFSARGSGGQYIVVAPAYRIVVVHMNDLEHNDRMKSSEFGRLLRRIFAAAPGARPNASPGRPGDDEERDFNDE
jgi:CubicO group peptidase (beta-lactamase class C family)